MEQEKDDVQVDSSATQETEQVSNAQPEGEKVENAAPQAAEVSQEPKEELIPASRVENLKREYQRKLEETLRDVPRVIEETLQKQTKPKEQEPTIPQLKAFLKTTDDPQSIIWAEEKIMALEKAERQREIEGVLTAERQKISAVQIKQQIENQVISDPAYSEAFVVDKSGTKQWNPESPITRYAGEFLQDPDLQRRPDALAIAMELAYAKHMRSKTGSVAQSLTAVKRENAKLKQQTLVEGGVNVNVAKKSEIELAHQELAKTGSKKALRTLTSAILKKQGLL